MLNKNFQGWLNENNKKDLIDNFIKSLDDLNETKLVKIDTENLEEGRPLLYFEFIHQIKSFKNLIYFCFFHKMVGAAGFEPATLWSQTRCATRLRYAPMVVFIQH